MNKKASLDPGHGLEAAGCVRRLESARDFRWPLTGGRSIHAYI